jgi:hypothetical protein
MPPAVAARRLIDVDLAILKSAQKLDAKKVEIS